MIKIKNKKNKHLKKIAIVTTPIVLLCVISYVSITSKPQASESTFAYEHYYEDESEEEAYDKFTDIFHLKAIMDNAPKNSPKRK